MAARGRLCHNGSFQGASADNFFQEEPRTMGDESFEMWTETMAGLDEYVTGGPWSSRIPVLTSKWAYENWLQRRNNANFVTDTGRRAIVPRVPGSRIPVAVDTPTYATSFRSLERRSEYFCERRTTVSQPSRIPLRTSAGQNQPCLHQLLCTQHCPAGQ
jgi:hypothetical protein